jgi:Zn-dependent alcohol dehydrogenase
MKNKCEQSRYWHIGFKRYSDAGGIPIEKMISRVYQLEEINHALSELEKGQAHRILIRMDNSQAI